MIRFLEKKIPSSGPKLWFLYPFPEQTVQQPTYIAHIWRYFPSAPCKKSQWQWKRKVTGKIDNTVDMSTNSKILFSSLFIFCTYTYVLLLLTWRKALIQFFPSDPSQFMYLIFRGRVGGEESFGGRRGFQNFCPLHDGNYGNDENHDGLI